MTIYDAEGVVVLDITVDDTSYRNRAIMGDDTLTLYYSLVEHVELPVGAWCEVENVRYTLMRPEAFKKKHSRRYEYTVSMESDTGKAKIWKFRNTVDGRLKFSLTAQPWEHVQMFVDNMNARDPDGEVWERGACVECVEKLVNYDHAYCYEALGQMADTFETEFEIAYWKHEDGKLHKIVRLQKVEYNKGSHAVSLAYGKGKGFLPDVGRSNYGDTPPVEILYAQGGTDNVDRSKYGNSELLLPRPNKTIRYDGEHFEDEEGFDAGEAREYVTDDKGYSIRRNEEGALLLLSEESLDCSEIYPKRVGEISAVEETDAAKNFWDFWDESIPENLNYEDYLIAGETMTVIFQSGELAGREFEVEYTHSAKQGYAARHFAIVPQEIDGEMMPNETFKPGVGDTYAVFNCYLPEEYVSEAEKEMLKAAVRYMYENEEAKFTFTGEIDPIWFRNTAIAKDLYFVLGGYVQFADDHFDGEVRITGIKDYINKPYKIELTLSNGMMSSGFSTTLAQLESESVAIEDSYRSSVDYTKRRWRDAAETISMLEGALDNFTGSVSPITVQTMMMLVGDESLQFRFVASMRDFSVVTPSITWDSGEKELRVSSGSGGDSLYLQHLTLGITAISSDHSDEYRVWELLSRTLSPEDDSAGYYLYARCSTSAEEGYFVLSTSALALEENGFYNFLVGILNSEYEGERSYVSLYGFTEILPGRITTDSVVSGDGKSYFDMANNAMRLGEALDFNSEGDGKLRLKGTIVQSQSGDEEYIGCYRGVYNSTYTYYQGDEVTYELGGVSSSYRYTSGTPSQGHVPTESDYWQVIASGSSGEDGNYTELRYAVNSSTTKAPELDKTSVAPAGWSATYPEVGSGEYLWQTCAVKTGDGSSLVSEWSTPVRITPYDGKDGKDGKDGENGSSPVLVYRGEYDSSKEYYGTSDRRDAVHYNSTYYVTRTDAGTFTGMAPTDTAYWNQFGASFESVATELLLANDASIGDWYIRDGKIVSTLQDSGNKITLDAGKDSGVPKITVRSQYNGYVEIDGEEAEIDAWTSSTSGNGAEMSAKGFYTNRAYTVCESTTTGRDRQAGLCVNAYGEVGELASGAEVNANFLAGIYARVKNTFEAGGDYVAAQSYGAYVERLYTRGLVLGVTVVRDGEEVALTETDTLVVGTERTSGTSASCTVVMPSGAAGGQTIIIRNFGSSKMTLKAADGDKLWTYQEVSNFSVSAGKGVIATAVNTQTTTGETTTKEITWLLSGLPQAT